jgi:hypothetical protein
MADEVRVIVGTAVTVGAAIAGFALWAFKAVIAKEVTPTLIQLGTEANALTREFAAFREAKDEERREFRQILGDLDKIVRDHELRITVLEQPTPPAAVARKRRAA